jgi:PIN domain nuclease of toxin-antitoxin system
MKVLLDTCTFLWVVADASELTRAARACFVDPENDVYLSVVSAWEISVKHALGRLPLPDAPGRFVPAERMRHRIESLPLDEPTALHLDRLPNLHRDPFDRILVCQALIHGMTVLTPDSALSSYPIRTLW